MLEYPLYPEIDEYPLYPDQPDMPLHPLVPAGPAAPSREICHDEYVPDPKKEVSLIVITPVEGVYDIIVPFIKAEELYAAITGCPTAKLQ